MTIRQKLVAGNLSIVAVALLVVTFFTFLNFQADEAVLRRALEVHAADRTSNLASLSGFALALDDAAGLTADVEAFAAASPDFLFAHVVKTDLTPLVQQGQGEAGDRLVEYRASGTTLPAHYATGDTLLTLKAVEAEGRVVGYVACGESMSAVAATRRRFFGTAVVMGVVAFVLSALLAMVLGARLCRPLQDLADAASRVASGELRMLTTVSAQDEVGTLSRAFNDMVTGLRGALQAMGGTTSDLEELCEGILVASRNHSAFIGQQAVAMQQAATTAKMISETSEQAIDHAENVIRTTQRSEDASVEGNAAVEASIAGMKEIHRGVTNIAADIDALFNRIKQISTIISSVAEIAEQSNILAVNASIQAAKAGEHGRGFAVVAGEVRGLAERSKTATEKVRHILGEVEVAARNTVTVTRQGMALVEEGVEVTTLAGEAIRKLTAALDESKRAASEIAASARSQGLGVQQIAGVLSEITNSGESAVQGTEELENASSSLRELGQRMSTVVQRYRT